MAPAATARTAEAEAFFWLSSDLLREHLPDAVSAPSRGLQRHLPSPGWLHFQAWASPPPPSLRPAPERGDRDGGKRGSGGLSGSGAARSTPGIPFTIRDDYGRVSEKTGRMEEHPLRVLMFGWDFPARLSGGLGPACRGITEALSGLGHKVIMVFPRGNPSREPRCGLERNTDREIDARPVPSPLTPYQTPASYRPHPLREAESGGSPAEGDLGPIFCLRGSGW
jgi:hypothetical protein